METFNVLIELAVVLIAIVIGVRAGGIGLGIWGLAGLFVLVIGFHSEPGSAPVDVVFIILAAITAVSVMEAAGGIAWMVSLAAKLLRRHPRAIVFVAPFVSALFTIGAGTGNMYYALLPIIYDVSYTERVRPERPISVATVASQAAIVCSPVSAATAAAVVLLGDDGFSLAKVLVVTWTASFVALTVASLVMLRWGRELDEDGGYLARKAAGEVPEIEVKSADELPAKAKLSALIFLAGIAMIVIFGLFEDLRPVVGEGEAAFRVGVPVIIQMSMGVAAAAILVLCGPKVSDVPRQPVFAPGVVAAIALFGLAWLANAFLVNNDDVIIPALSDLLTKHSWMFAFVLMLIAILTTSQAATVAAIVPIGLSVGLSPALIVGMLPAVAAVMILPTQGAQIAAVEFDKTGTTRLGKFLVDHSFQIPTLIYIVVAVPVGVLVASLIG